MTGHSFRKAERLLKWAEFKKVMDNGKRRRLGTACTVFWIENELSWKRCGIITSKKIGSAVARNRAKRKIREVFRLNRGKIKPALDIVIIAGRESINLPFSTLEKKITRVFE